MTDPNFERSVVLLCEHQYREGSFGLVLNKPSEYALDDVVDDFYYDGKLYIGGPVEQNTLHYIHTFAELKNAVPLGDGVYWGGDYEELRALSVQGRLTETNCRFFIGYSGWGAGQLRGELKRKSWLVYTFPLSDLFSLSSEELWGATLRAMGGKFKVLSHYPTDPRLN